MPKICVEIEFDTETGQYTVEKCEPKEEMAEGEISEVGMMKNSEMGGKPMVNMVGMKGSEAEDGEQSFQDINEALAAVKNILAGGDQSEMDMAKGFSQAGQPQGAM